MQVGYHPTCTATPLRAEPTEPLRGYSRVPQSAAEYLCGSAEPLGRTSRHRSRTPCRTPTAIPPRAAGGRPGFIPRCCGSVSGLSFRRSAAGAGGCAATRAARHTANSQRYAAKWRTASEMALRAGWHRPCRTVHGMESPTAVPGDGERHGSPTCRNQQNFEKSLGGANDAVIGWLMASECMARASAWTGQVRSRGRRPRNGSP